MVNNFIGNGIVKREKCADIRDTTFNIAAKTTTAAYDSIRTAANDIEFQRCSNIQAQSS
jgi:hypothetical protein